MGIIIKNGKPYKTIYKSITNSGICLIINTILTRYFGQTVYITDGIKTATGVFSNEGICVINGVDMNGEVTIKVIVDGIEYASTAIIQTDYEIEFTIDFNNPGSKKIYGASWTMGVQDTQWTRTDDAISFSSPIPSINGGTGFSAFDKLLPWKGMKIEKRSCGDMVAIPKFYYKISIDGDILSVKISGYKHDGFYTSPAHMDRGDGKGERNIVYVSRYFCGSGYFSKTHESIITNDTITNARNSIHALGENIYQFDYLMWLTLWLLYIVEYADWNYAAKIGTSLNDYSIKTGSTDNMGYHTGTIAENPRTASRGVQYRNIEGLLTSPSLWLDGMFYQNSHIYLIKNPQYFNITDPSAEGVYDLGTYLGGYYNVSRLALTDSINSIKAAGSVDYRTSGYTCSYHELYNGKTPRILGGGGWMQFITAYYDRDRRDIGSRSIELP